MIIVWGYGTRVSRCPDQPANWLCAHPRCVGRLEAFELSRYCHICFLPISEQRTRKFLKCKHCGLAFGYESYERHMQSQNTIRVPGRVVMVPVQAVPTTTAADSSETEIEPIMVQAELLEENPPSNEEPGEKSESVVVTKEVEIV